MIQPDMSDWGGTSGWKGSDVIVRSVVMGTGEPVVMLRCETRLLCACIQGNIIIKLLPKLWIRLCLQFLGSLQYS